MNCEYCNKKTKIKIYGEFLCEYHYKLIYTYKEVENLNENTNEQNNNNNRCT